MIMRARSCTGPTVRDRRRIDPETYQVREPQETAAPAAEAPGNPTASTVEVDELKIALAERTADLQRLQAEYVNYKRRVDRDRDLARKVAVETHGQGPAAGARRHPIGS